jgi:hypothetical protein
VRENSWLQLRGTCASRSMSACADSDQGPQRSEMSAVARVNFTYSIHSHQRLLTFGTTGPAMPLRLLITSKRRLRLW